MWIAYRFFLFCVSVGLRFWFSIHLEGRENIPHGGGYIIASNHTSNIDPLLLAMGVPHPINYMGKAELFQNPILGALFRSIHVIRVERGKGDTGAVEECAKLVENDHVLGIFPEGTRYKIGEPGRPKSGMALIAKMTQADILPCCVLYEPGKKFRSKAVVRFGELIPFEELGFETDSPREIKTATKKVWGTILGLMGLEESHD